MCVCTDLALARSRRHPRSHDDVRTCRARTTCMRSRAFPGRAPRTRILSRGPVAEKNFFWGSTCANTTCRPRFLGYPICFLARHGAYLNPGSPPGPPGRPTPGSLFSPDPRRRAARPRLRPPVRPSHHNYTTLGLCLKAVRSAHPLAEGQAPPRWRSQHPSSVQARTARSAEASRRQGTRTSRPLRGLHQLHSGPFGEDTSAHTATGRPGARRTLE